MTAAENVCYTLINVTSDSEPPSEVSLKTDLGKYSYLELIKIILTNSPSQTMQWGNHNFIGLYIF